jgi:YidC/Oxa1 family membrane protein insertase
MDTRRMMLAFVLSLGVVVAYERLVVQPRQPPPPMQPGTNPEPAHPAAPAPDTTSPTPPALAPASSGGYLSSNIEERDVPVVVETDLWRATLTPRGGRLTSLQLKQFRRTVDASSPPLELIEPATLLPLTVALDANQSDASVEYRPSVKALDLHGDESGEIVFAGTTAANAPLEKRIRFLGNSYVVDVAIKVGGQSAPKSVGLVMPQLEREGLRANGSATNAAVFLSQDKIHETHLVDEKISELKPESYADSRWVAFSVPFFAGALISSGDTGASATVEHVGSRAIVRMDQPLVEGATAFKAYWGPKSKEVLADAGYQLSRLIDFGWFWFIAIPMLYALRLLHTFTGNYGVDIILLTALVRAATIPLTQKSFRSMKDMQKIQPQLKRLQEQYKDDQGKLQKEMMELYKRHGVNPFGGCAPMVLQIPIFVGLYNALMHAIELRHAPFAFWITDLSAPERLLIAGWGIPVMTILMGGTMLVQQWLTPQQAGVDPTQRQVMMFMPLIFTYMFLNFPAGLVLYWLVSNLLGITQQYLMLRST